MPGVALGSVVFLIWSAAALSAMVSHPTRTALGWAWQNYLIVLRRCEELRDRQG